MLSGAASAAQVIQVSSRLNVPAHNVARVVMRLMGDDPINEMRARRPTRQAAYGPA